MSQMFAKLATALAISAFAISSQAATLTFEDLNPAPASYDIMPASYNGFQFNGWFYGPDTVYTPGSGIIDLFTDYADPNDPGAFVVTNTNNSVTSSTAFIFDGAVFSGYSGVTFELWFNGSLVHTSASLQDSQDANPYLPTFLASGYGGAVDRVVVSGVQGYYSMDDFQFQQASTVPEPGSLGIASLALFSLAVMTLRRRKLLA